MNLPGLQRITVSSTADALTLSRQLMQLIGGLCASLNRLLSNPDAVSTYQNVALSSVAPNIIGHKLELKEGQTPLGWQIVDKDTAADVWRTAWDHRVITIQTNADCNVRLRVY